MGAVPRVFRPSQWCRGKTARIGRAHGRCPPWIIFCRCGLEIRPIRTQRKATGARLEEFRSLHFDFVSHQEALDSSTPLGKAMFTIIGAMAELERNIIRERVLAGMDHARRNGTKSGQPVGRPKAVFDRDEVISLRNDEGLSWREIARKLRVGGATVRRAYKDWQTAQAALNGDADSSDQRTTNLDHGSVAR
jgi:DNA invertase Pin-like site-specific DNA recombinase